MLIYNMNSVAIALYALAAALLAYAGFLFSKNDGQYVMCLVSGAVLAVCGFLAGSMIKNEINSFYEKFENLQQSLNILGASRPTLSKQCIENPAANSVKGDANKFLQSQIELVRTTQADLQKAYYALRGNPNAVPPIPASTTWTSATKLEQDALDAKFNRVNALCNQMVNSSTQIVNGKTLQSWQGIYTCDDYCSAFDQATYTTGGNCTCPQGMYPVLNGDFVTCSMIDKSMYTTIDSQLDKLEPSLKSIPIPARVSSFNFFCGNSACPIEAPLIGEITTPTATTAAPTPAPTTRVPTAAPTPAPTTVAPTSAPTPIATLSPVFNGTLATGSLGQEPLTVLASNLSATALPSGQYRYTYNTPSTSGFIRFWVRTFSPTAGVGTASLLIAITVQSSTATGLITIPTFARGGNYQLVANAETASPVILQLTPV